MKYNGRIIDSHIHIRGGFDDLDSFIRGTEQLRIQSGVDAAVIASIPPWDDEFIGQNIISLTQKASYPGTTYVFAGLDYHMPAGVPREDFATQARRFIEMGCDGIKMLEGKPAVRKLIGDIPLNSSLYLSFYAYMEREQIPLLLHAADPETFWDDRLLPNFARINGWGYTDGTFASKEQIYAEMVDVFQKFPGLKVSLAHFFFTSADIERSSHLLNTYPNINFDITPGTEMYANFSAKRDEWRDFFTQYSSRILFGTDNGWDTSIPMEQRIITAASFVSDIRRFLETSDEFIAFNGFDMPISGLNLDRRVLEDIYLGNFLRFSSAAPHSLKMDEVISYTEKMVEIFRGSSMAKYHPSFIQMEKCQKILLTL